MRFRSNECFQSEEETCPQPGKVNVSKIEDVIEDEAPPPTERVNIFDSNTPSYLAVIAGTAFFFEEELLLDSDFQTDSEEEEEEEEEEEDSKKELEGSDEHESESESVDELTAELLQNQVVDEGNVENAVKPSQDKMETDD